MPARPIALSCGEPAGIGPEIALKAWEALGADLPFFLIGAPDHVPGGPVEVIGAPSEAAGAARRGLPVLAHDFTGPLTPGAPNPRHADSVIGAIRRGVKVVQAGEAAALCTAPIHKKALQDGAGFAHPGHTEFLAHLAGVERVVMMLASDQLRVVPVTIHIPLAEAPGALTPDLLRVTLRITHAALIRDFGITRPRIAVAGLNPHAGEGGKMGEEEITIIAPVLDALRAEGMEIAGPLSADTMFHAAARAGYDAAVAMYHDQALIPIKTLDFDRGVNVTLGLPFVRTSPDHGTALDIAGQGVANPSSLIEALKLAARMGGT
ncbi:4-hydroxythreonine-4-phosphate dehydrogenase PdxA [Roseovarius spongiae]|uniref:4-hydroxythreonine-4-phosphate dehydrogenase n=1 Tax=Roseovarius spongiae TaxID=2320272 RepID=A0A3A8B4W1_9RHOB|nr:4-hydroxythreonine-4-phosphate dehydrogenase PdxA [Roseovarius spongiae]RKF16931.1 4-hydroxythreonine-4-phosphate dehydrogenase PdxA [Roseovarius spongiae]